MCEKGGLFWFDCAEEDSLYAEDFLQEGRPLDALSDREIRCLDGIRKRRREGRIYLSPAVIYAAANQETCRRWMQNAGAARKKEWYDAGVEWMRRRPAFLEKFGWRERSSALMAAGILSRAERGKDSAALKPLRWMLKGGWRFLWEEIKSAPCLDASVWKGLGEPWKDSRSMSCAMDGVILLTAVLLHKPVRERDQFWSSLCRLKRFTEECPKAPAPEAALEKKDAGSEEEDVRMIWLMSHFRNPQRPAYIRERGRLCSEWLEQLYRVTALAGLPVSACENMELSGQEVWLLLETMEEKPTERQYMTFLLLYAVARELAQAGRIAAKQERPGEK